MKRNKFKSFGILKLKELLAKAELEAETTDNTFDKLVMCTLIVQIKNELEYRGV